MKVSREQMAENRIRILDCASRLFREKGFEAVTVAEVMKAAGLTHGGFYGHFKSKDDLAAQALATSLEKNAGATLGLEAYLDSYLSARHRDNPGNGCPTAGLAAEARLQSEAVRSTITQGFRAQLDCLSQVSAGETETERRRAAIGTWATMVGAIILARAVDDPALSDEVLEQSRAWIGSHANVASAIQ
jgi:TetR/AcrR family transcriptional repressor of nem operon